MVLKWVNDSLPIEPSLGKLTALGFSIMLILLMLESRVPFGQRTSIVRLEFE